MICGVFIAFCGAGPEGMTRYCYIGCYSIYALKTSEAQWAETAGWADIWRDSAARSTSPLGALRPGHMLMEGHVCEFFVCCLLQVFFWSSADLQGSASREKIEGCAGCIAQLFVWVRPCVFQAYRCRIRPRGGTAFGPLQGEHRLTGGEHPFVCVSCAWGSCAYGSKIGQWPTEKALSEGQCRE